MLSTFRCCRCVRGKRAKKMEKKLDREKVFIAHTTGTASTGSKYYRHYDLVYQVLLRYEAPLLSAICSPTQLPAVSHFPSNLTPSTLPCSNSSKGTTVVPSSGTRNQCIGPTTPPGTYDGNANTSLAFSPPLSPILQTHNRFRPSIIIRIEWPDGFSPYDCSDKGPKASGSPLTGDPYQLAEQLAPHLF
jgi:hypothetical protein